mmetsp:Transcript_54981/g.128560  ORF Transcript_54981/g.128560 Transcript_54981/m.128560 type:complete len:169 (+) Transcript_54981:296-802(+)
MESWALPVVLKCKDEETRISVTFKGLHHIASGVLYARPDLHDGDSTSSNFMQLAAAAERPTKGAITALLDVAEACGTRKITLGLCEKLAATPDFVCSLLYLGFRVVPPRKSPLGQCGLLLDLTIQQVPGSNRFATSSSDNTCTATSECSTSAEELRGGLDSDHSLDSE